MLRDFLLVTIPIAVAYLTGALYLNSYAGQFGIGLYEIEMGIEGMLLQSYNVFREPHILGVIAFLCLIVFFLSVIIKGSKIYVWNIEIKDIPIAATLSFWIILFISSLYAIQFTASAIAREDARLLWIGQQRSYVQPFVDTGKLYQSMLLRGGKAAFVDQSPLDMSFNTIENEYNYRIKRDFSAFISCMGRLNTIIKTRNSEFYLCRSREPATPVTGQIFHLSSDGKLLSIRDRTYDGDSR